MEIPSISRARLKEINPDSAETGDGTDARPTEQERKWIELVRSTDASREVMRRRAAVCSIADVVRLTKDEIEITYDGANYVLKRPVNGFRIAQAREQSIMAALSELNAQRCIWTSGAPINKNFENFEASLIKLLGDVAENFFFTPFL